MVINRFLLANIEDDFSAQLLRAFFDSDRMLAAHRYSYRVLFSVYLDYSVDRD